MKLYAYLLYSTIILIIPAACQPAKPPQLPPPGTGVVYDTSAISGTWYNDDNIFGCMTLTISDSNRFSFYEAGCNMNRYSAGSIRRDGNNLHFTSDAQYKPAVETPAANMLRGDKQGRYEPDTAALRSMSVSVKMPAPGDTVNVYLNNEHYLLKKDTLYKLDRGGFKTDAKFHR